MASLIDPAVHDAQAMRQAGPDLLSLALMDARNRTLSWLAVFDAVPELAPLADLDPPAWLAGHAGWFQERWIARHLQRRQGARADTSAAPLASIERRSDPWFDPRRSSREQRWARPPAADAVRGYLADTLDTTLELLSKATPDDDGLYVFRLALAQEDRSAEALAALAQAAALPPQAHQQAVERGLWPALPSRSRRDPLWLPSQGWMLGSAPGGWVPEAERWAHPVTLPEFEIDSQPVSWGQYAEFIGDGGYDDRRWWSESGWRWLSSMAAGRRAPRFVEQANGGVLAQRQGRLQRLPSAQSVLHVSVHEAEAWCCWAGRRLPTEAEWELAACTAASRGFAWGEGLEWVLGSARAYPTGDATASQPAAAALLDPLPVQPGGRVLRGTSAFGSARLRHPRARRYRAGDDDALFTSFRSCAA